MVDTVNYDPSLEERLRHPIQHLYQVVAEPNGAPHFDLAVDGELSVAFSLGWSPYAQASLKIKSPRTAAERDALDGRLRTYVSVYLGYAFDGITNKNQTVRLRLEDAEETSGNQWSLSLQGREMEAQGANWNADWNGTANRAGVREFIEYVLSSSFNGPVTVDNPGYGLGYRPDLVANVMPGHGTNLWSIASGVADSAGLKLWHDGGSTWKLLPRYGLSSTYASMLRTGKNGTITDWTHRRRRSEWYNRVELVFPDSLDGIGRPIVGLASVNSGPFSYLTVGARTYTEQISGWASQDSANARAASMLQTLSARGSSYTIQAAAAYWIRPGMTVPVKTGRGPYERQLVESVTFTPLNGLMTLDTIKNED